ncbi:Transcription factor spt20 [Agyrium rufum]|nr:Transcription factor spt20 [Agyrium rufum]
MAAVATARTGIAHTKMKRPPSLLTGEMTNGAHTLSPSPSLASAKPPLGTPNSAGLQQGTIHGLENGVNGAGSRTSVRRRDSQKPGEISNNRQVRLTKGAGVDGAQAGQKLIKKIMEPYVKTESYILKKHRKAPPSFILHLHPTHFRFDQQDGSFSYSSPMKVLLEHVRLRSVPHDMLDELLQAGIKFYEGIVDPLVISYAKKTNVSTSTQSSGNTSNRDKNVPFSIHNWNEHLTPSPFVPYPQLDNLDTVADNDLGKENALGTKQDPNIKKEPDTQDTSEESNGVVKPAVKGSKSFTAVLFPTPVSLHEEVLAYANTPDMRSNHRKQSQMSNRGSTGGMNQPPTPLSAVPPTPSTFGPPAKRQKMMISGNDIAAFEGKVISATTAPLFLEPAENAEDVENILNSLSDPLFKYKPPAPKTRKKTSAELAADDALAAEEERYMLIMDERLAPSANAAGAGTTGADGETGVTSFTPDFERFKALENIKAKLQQAQETARRADQARAEQIAHQAAIQKAKQEAAEREARLQATNVRHQQLHAMNLEQHRRAEMMKVQQNQAAAAAAAHAHNQTGQHATNSALTNGHLGKDANGNISSPVVRNMTPHNNIPSPHGGNAAMSSAAMSVPMTATTSNQGAGSPPRPGSAAQHAHPTAATMMAQRANAQATSRTGTPRLPNGTPALQQATPVTRHMTPTPGMSHGSPALSVAASTPTMGQARMPTPQIGGPPQMTQQQQMFARQQALLQQQQHQQNQQHHQAQMAALHQRRQQQAQQQQQQQQQAMLQQGSPNGHMNLQQQMAQHQNHAPSASPQGTQEQYRLQLEMMQQQQHKSLQARAQAQAQHAQAQAVAQAQAQGFSQQQHMMGTPQIGGTMNGLQNRPGQPGGGGQAQGNPSMQQGMGGMRFPNAAVQAQYASVLKTLWQKMQPQLIQNYGSLQNVPEAALQRAQMSVQVQAKAHVSRQLQMRNAQQQQQAAQMQQQQQRAAMGAGQQGGGGGGGGGGQMMMGNGNGGAGGMSGQMNMGGMQNLTPQQQQQQFALQAQAHARAQAQQQMLGLQAQARGMGGGGMG